MRRRGLGPVAVTSWPFRSTRPRRGRRNPESTSISSAWPFPSTPQIPRISPRRSSRFTPLSAACPWLPCSVEILGNQHGLARVRRWAVDAQRDRAADHHLGQLRRGRLRGFARADRPAPANHRHPVADRRHLAQLVGDEDDRVATLAQPVEDVVELVDLLRGQQRGRLVQDQRLPALIERAQDLDPLLHPDRQVADDRVGIDVEAVLIGRARRPAGRPPRGRARSPLLRTRE